MSGPVSGLPAKRETLASDLAPAANLASGDVVPSVPTLLDTLSGPQRFLDRARLNAWTDAFLRPQGDTERASGIWVDYVTPPPLAAFAGVGRRARLAWPVNSRNTKRPPLPPAPKHGCTVVIKTWRRRQNLALVALTEQDLIDCYPVRKFQRQHNQEHKPGTVWLHTNQDLVAFESQNERNFAVLADFHPDVCHIASQPMTMRFMWRGEETTHTPDFVVVRSNGCPIFIDVKTPEEAAKSEWVAKHAAVAHQLAGAGFGHIVWTGVHHRIIQNLGMLASAKPRDDVFNARAPQVLALVRSNPGASLDAIARMSENGGVPATEARVLIRRMLWTGLMDMNFASRFDGRLKLAAA